MRPFGEHRRALHPMTRDCPSPCLQRYRFYQYLLLVELMLTIVVLAVSIATAVGLL
ncbi:hypothetical protein [Natronosalvus rutilus]|uniref:Uncharacterized protein n=1 Tax=Natronosalvus rutilus TaxID=2953753 RepID=A0A9E7N9X3_9EURY|nr:hypothetical protein [Natronosalvus rutilus]UTF54494.1 hypothetical protein NGM29_04245 [Natronosalvus rutilus]